MQPELEYYREKGLNLIIATADSSELMAGLLEEYNLNAVVLDDRRGDLARQFGIRSLPSGFLFNRDGVMEDVMVGWHQENSLLEWKAKVEEALK